MAALWFLAACHGNVEIPSNTTTTGPTWRTEVAPIVVASCGECHTAGGLAPFALDTYADAAPMAQAIAAATASGQMPPWGAVETDECTPRAGWENDQRLSDDEKATLQAWADAGAPEGDLEDAADIPQGVDMSLTEVDSEVYPIAPYVTSGQDDEFVCFSIDPELASNVWVTGVEVLPGDRSVVHHVVVSADPYGESAALAGDDGVYDCFSGAAVTGETIIGLWVPGAFPTRPPEGSGFPVAAGSRIVLQMHYHPAGDAGKPDLTGIRLSYQKRPTIKTAYLTGVGNAYDAATGLAPGEGDRYGVPEFRIPAGETDHTERMSFDFGDVGGRYDVWAMEAHMHMVGVDLLATVTHPDGDAGVDEECLIHEPAWNFDWQRLYVYDRPVVTLGNNDVISLRCKYDNTLNNPGTERALNDAGLSDPQDVYIGESSYDEMCVVIFGITY